MKKGFVLVFVLAMTMVCYGQKLGKNGNEEFDITKYLGQMKDNSELRYAISAEELSPKEYALVDIDGDGQNELMVRDTDINYQAIYTIEGDSLWMLAYADGATDLEFYKNGVGYQAYYTPGRSFDGACLLQNSRHGEWYMHEVQFDISSDDEEVTYEMYLMNGKDATAEECEAFKKKLGDPVEALTAEWQPLPKK